MLFLWQQEGHSAYKHHCCSE